MKKFPKFHLTEAQRHRENREQGIGNRNLVLILVIILIPLVGIAAQEDFGFGDFAFDDEGFGFQESSSSGGRAALSVNIGGKAAAGFTGFLDICDSAENFKETRLGDVFSGSLNFDAGGSAAQGVINLNFRPAFDGFSPVEIDEAYVRAFFGPVTVLGGIRKISWGKADSFGPLDVINSLDYRDLTKLSDPQSVKIARPMLHSTWSAGSFTKLEAVFVPWFQGHKFATTGRWAPGQVNYLRAVITETLTTAEYRIKNAPSFPAHLDKDEILAEIPLIGASLENSIDNENFYPDTGSLKYAQAGLRFTTSIGSSDFGFQYYFGRLPRPVVNGLNPNGFFSLVDGLHPEALVPDINYNYYHQIGADFARVISGFNLRAEFGANITKDLDGTDGNVENPALVWSLGFDRDLIANINLNLQGTGRFTLFHDKINSDPLVDCQAGSKITSTRLTAVFSRKFLRDELELKVSGLWGIEDKDFLVMPSVVWSRNDVSAELSMGFFGGDREGELGQYRDNGFAKVMLTYKF